MNKISFKNPIKGEENITFLEVVHKNNISDLEIGFLLSGFGQHIVPISISTLNDEYVLRHNLDGLISINKLSYYSIEENLGLLKKIIESIKYGQEFILDMRKIEISPNTLYFSKRKQRILFVYNPTATENINDKILKVLDYLEIESSVESKKSLKKIKREIGVYNLSTKSILKLIDEELESQWISKPLNEKEGTIE